jgi:NAD+ kinase
MKVPMKVLLVINPQKPASGTLALEIEETLAKEGAKIKTIKYTDRESEEGDFDIAFSLGGDGTVLFAARTVASRSVPLLALNLGTLGFIAAISKDEWKAAYNDWKAGKASISERIMLSVNVLRHTESGVKSVFEAVALNDAVISASGIAKTIKLNVSSGDKHIAYYRSDGLIVATPTGSTAYCASAGGPILDPEMEALVVNPICPFTLLHRPLVLPGGEHIAVNIDKEQSSGVLLTIDGQVTESLEGNDKVLLCKSPYKAALIASGRHAFYRALHTKLHWMNGPEIGYGEEE